jgi:RNA polymerase sigma-70 factor, ECF subfamily
VRRDSPPRPYARGLSPVQRNTSPACSALDETLDEPHDTRRRSVIGDGFDRVLAAARDGDELAWSALYDSLAPQLLGYLRGRGAPEPEDQLGETFLQVARDLSSFAGDEAGFRSWVFTIAHRRLLDAVRSRRRRPAVPLPPERLAPVAETLRGADAEGVVAGGSTGGPDVLLDAVADRELVLGLLAHLTEDQREVLLLRFVADLDTATVGDVTGRSANAVAAVTTRALATLREVLGVERG